MKNEDHFDARERSHLYLEHKKQKTPEIMHLKYQEIKKFIQRCPRVLAKW